MPDGYAPFCKVHVHENWAMTCCAAVPITLENQQLLRSAYEARRPEDLPVLTRWLEGIDAPRGHYLLVILYDREQMIKQGDPCDADQAVVGYPATLQPEETPMAPFTM